MKDNLGDMDIRIAGKYKLGRKIGSGSFGDIYLGRERHTKNMYCNILL